MPDLIGYTLLNRYRLDDQIGEGGMARVFRATDLQRHTVVAIKILRQDLAADRELVRRFRAEARTLAQLDHSNIVHLYDFDQDDQIAFIAMEFIDGMNLSERLNRANAPLGPNEIRSIARQIGAALAHAHARGVIHRDVKPGNVMLTATGRALLSDFGIAKMADSVTITTVVPGTPAYSSPEQVLNRPLDYRTDIYSFGIVLYEMATGHRPFSGDTAPETLGSTADKVRWEHARAQPPDPRQFNPDVPVAVAQIILRALAKDPNARWQSIAEMSAAFESACAAWRGAEQPETVTWVPPTRKGKTPTDHSDKSPVIAPPRPATAPWGLLTVLAAITVAILIVPLTFLGNLAAPAVTPISPSQPETITPNPPTPATARPSLTPTATRAMITSTPLPPITPTPIGLIFFDDFERLRQDAIWPQIPQARQEQGVYQINDSQASRPAWTTSQTFGDFIYEVDAWKVAGPDAPRGFGVVLRATVTAEGYNYLVLLIRGDASYSVGQVVRNQWQQLIPWTPASAIKGAGQTNRLKVVCQGTQIVFYINDSRITNIANAPSSPGWIGVFADAGIHAAFDNVRVFIIR